MDLKRERSYFSFEMFIGATIHFLLLLFGHTLQFKIKSKNQQISSIGIAAYFPVVSKLKVEFKYSTVHREALTLDVSGGNCGQQQS